ncbi:MAG: DUF3006 domain-containing protein [Oscillospiraceae bacterium]|nr:DUF3006 domain-containing protein [Oscillospiraceae bacterium]
MNFDFSHSRTDLNSRERIIKSNDVSFSSFRQELQQHVNNFLNRIQIRHTEFTLDRIDSSFAVLENRSNGQLRNVPIDIIPPDAKDGDILKFEMGSYFIVHDLTEIARAEIRNLMKELRKQP